jgi:dihydrofolate reductase
MRKIAACLFMSLDGVVEKPEVWCPPYFCDEITQALAKSMDTSDAMLVGRRTYDIFAAHWPGRGTDDSSAVHMNNTPKYVVSTTMTTAEWKNSSLLRGDLVEEVTKLKQMPGKNINLSGSPTLARSLLRERLIDELWLLIVPTVLGKGSRLFPDGTEPIGLRLAESQTLSSGVVSLTYTPAEA